MLALHLTYIIGMQMGNEYMKHITAKLRAVLWTVDF